MRRMPRAKKEARSSRASGDLRRIGFAFVPFTRAAVGGFCLWPPRWSFALITIRVERMWSIARQAARGVRAFADLRAANYALRLIVLGPFIAPDPSLIGTSPNAVVG
jgi:hypothetical protein